MDIAGMKRLNNKEKETKTGIGDTITIMAKEAKVVGIPHRHPQPGIKPSSGITKEISAQTTGTKQLRIIIIMRTTTQHRSRTATIEVMTEGRGLTLEQIVAHVYHPQDQIVDVQQLLPGTETMSVLNTDRGTGQGMTMILTDVGMKQNTATVEINMTAQTIVETNNRTGNVGDRKRTIGDTTNASACDGNKRHAMPTTLNPLSRHIHRHEQALKARTLPLHQWLLHHVLQCLRL